jgi:hypothetical protein
VYAGKAVAEIEDRPLAHIRVVAMAKLRRNEAFAFTWETTTGGASGKSTVWLHPAIPLQFDFFGSREAVLNRAWIEQLIALANSPAGMRLVTEPSESAASVED